MTTPASDTTALVLLKLSEAQLKRLADSAAGRCHILCRTPAELTPAELEQAGFIFGNLDPVKLSACKHLQVLQLNSSGAEAYLKAGVLPEGARLCNAAGAYGTAVSEHMLALTFSLIRHFPAYRDQQREHLWADCGNIISIEGATILVLGLGDIGSAYARKVKALGARRVIGIRRSRAPLPDYLDECGTLSDVERYLPEADIVANVLPGGEQTAGLFNATRLKLMKHGAYLINVGRGNAIDQDALRAVLKDGHLSGCGLDVTTPEPLSRDDPLWDTPHLFITPHVAGNFFLAATLERVVDIAAANLGAWLAGQPLTHQLQPR